MLLVKDSAIANIEGSINFMVVLLMQLASDFLLKMSKKMSEICYNVY